jgi:uncharacterized protein
MTDSQAGGVAHAVGAAGRPAPAAGKNGQATQLARVRRRPDRARYDAEAVHEVLDATAFCHLATVRHGRPVVLPMVHARIGNAVVLHGSPAAGLLRDARGGSAVCLTATLLDGLVLARSARNHSVNYRSVTVHGRAVEVTDAEEVIAGLRALVEHLVPGRWEQVRRPPVDELRDTSLFRVTIEQASVKTRSGSTVEPESDLGLPVWAGEVPTRLVFGQPVPAEGVPAAIASAAVTVNPALAAVP